MLDTRETPSGVPSWAKTAAALAGLVLLVAGLVVVVLKVLSAPAPDGRKAQKITLIPTPPPPPPKPPEKPPEPPKPREEVKINQPPPPQNTPQPAPSNEPPPPGPLGLDAQGSGPGDGFGLAARPGGRDITVGGAQGGGGGGLASMTFGSGAARHIAQELARDARLKASNYRVELLVWIGRDGRIERTEIARGSGDNDVDAWIRGGLAQLSPLRQAVPENLPQPLRIRVTSSDV